MLNIDITDALPPEVENISHIWSIFISEIDTKVNKITAILDQTFRECPDVPLYTARTTTDNTNNLADYLIQETQKTPISDLQSDNTNNKRKEQQQYSIISTHQILAPAAQYWDLDHNAQISALCKNLCSCLKWICNNLRKLPFMHQWDRGRYGGLLFCPNPLLASSCQWDKGHLTCKLTNIFKITIAHKFVLLTD